MMSTQDIDFNEWADFWRHTIGVNVIPANSMTKKPKVTWAEWQDKAIPQEQHDSWKNERMFDEGMALVCGQIFHNTSKKGLWLNGIDCDNKLAIDEMCPSGIEKIAEMTIVEQHANKEKCHILFYTKEPIQSQAPLQGENIPKIEIKSGGKFLLYCAGCVHKDGSPIEILENRRVKIIEDKKLLEERIDDVFKKYNLEYLKKSELSITDYQKPLYEVTQKLHEGNNRGIHILSYLDSKKIKNPELNEDDLFHLARKYEKENCVGMYNDVKIRELVREAIQYGCRKIQEHNNSHTGNSQNGTHTRKTVDETAHLIESGRKFVTLRKTDEILVYNGKIYSNDDAQSTIKEETEKIIDNCTTHERVEVVNKIKAQTYIDMAEFDNDPKLITVNNGILDLDSIELREHSPQHFSRVLVPLEYHPPEHVINDETIFEDIEKNLKDTLFWKFLKLSFTVNGVFKKEYFETCLEIYASVFIKRQIDEKAFINLGKGENGKSAFLEYIEQSLGRDNVSSLTLQDIAEQTFMAAELDGISANIFTDLEQYELKKSGKIKAITGGEGLQVQKKNQHPFQMHAFAKLLFSCNRFPKVFDQTHGFFRRWIIVKWERDFENDPQRDANLKQKLVENDSERNKVFSSIIHLSRRLEKTNQFSHGKDWREIQKEWNANADPIDDFVTTYIVESDNNKTVREVYQFYKEKMFDKGENPLTLGRFGRLFAEYFDQDRVTDSATRKTQRVWLNIEFREPMQMGLEQYHE